MNSTITVSFLIHTCFLQCKIKINKLNLSIHYTKYPVRSITAFISSLTLSDSHTEQGGKPTTNP